MRRVVPIRRFLRRNIVGAIALLGFAILTATFFISRHGDDTLARLLTREAINHTEEKLSSFFSPVVKNLEIASVWGEKGILIFDHPDALNNMFVPIMTEYPQISSLLVADSDGNEYMCLHADGVWHNRITRAGQTGIVRWRTWQNDPERVEESWRKIDYDPRRRPWYQAAMAPGESESTKQIHWTHPYTFFTTGDLGITASIRFENGDNLDHVIGFDVLLNDISRFTKDLHVSENGQVYVLTDDRRVIGFPSGGDDGDLDSEAQKGLRTPESLKIDLLSAASAAMSGLNATGNGPTRFVSNGQLWWGEVRPFRMADSHNLWIAVFVPESDLVGDLTEMRLWILGITAVVLLYALYRVSVMARRISDPIESLVRQSERIREGDLAAGRPIESRFREVNRLAKSLDRMRIAVRSLLKLESDLRLAQEIQHDTFPAALPQLDGFVIEAWTESAEQTSGDTYDIIGFHDRPGKAGVIATDSAERVILLMADASGHGIGPALSVIQVRAMLRMAARAGENLVDVARHMNQQLYADLHEGRFVTAWLGELNVKTHTLTSFSAGQGPLLHYDAKLQRMQFLNPDALPFGVDDDLVAESLRPFEMLHGDLFAVISDGVYEAASPFGEEFGQERVSRVILEHINEEPAHIIAALRKELRAFTKNVTPADDRTVVIIKRDGKKQAVRQQGEKVSQTA